MSCRCNATRACDHSDSGYRPCPLHRAVSVGADGSISRRQRRIQWVLMIVGDRRGLQQVLSNLLINALDALEEKQPAAPSVVVSTQLSEERVILTVSDNADGIPREIQDKVFDPFFTTKPADKGTGLGRAIVEAIVHQHGADITLESAPGEGTAIRIVFSRDNERTTA